MQRLRAAIVDAILGDDVPPGAIRYTVVGVDEVAGFRYRCPCGCGGQGVLKFGGKAWLWNGDTAAPTVYPDIHFNPGEPGEWRGYLRDGYWESM